MCCVLLQKQQKNFSSASNFFSKVVTAAVWYFLSVIENAKQAWIIFLSEGVQRNCCGKDFQEKEHLLKLSADGVQGKAVEEDF